MPPIVDRSREHRSRAVTGTGPYDTGRVLGASSVVYCRSCRRVTAKDGAAQFSKRGEHCCQIKSVVPVPPMFRTAVVYRSAGRWIEGAAAPKESVYV